MRNGIDMIWGPRKTSHSATESTYYLRSLRRSGPGPFSVPRHLLVHHAGYYTLQHLKKNAVPQEIVDRAFKDCVVIETEGYQKVSNFLFEMAMKVTRGTMAGLNIKWKAAGTG